MNRNFVHTCFSLTLAKISFTWGVHPVKTHCVKGLLEVTPFFTSRVVKIELIHAVRLLIKVICSKNLSITSAAPIVSEPERGTEGFKTASKLHV